jgi:hypothetical protein
MGSVAVLTSCVGFGISGLLAAFLGMIALDRIRREAPALRGRGLAWTGIALGLVAFTLSVIVAWGLQSLQKEWHADLDRALARTFAISTGATAEGSSAGDDGGAELGAAAVVDEGAASEALKSWIGREGATVTAAELTSFATEARARFGGFRGFRALSEDRQGGFQSVQRVVVTAEFDFETGPRLGSMGFCFITDTRSLLPEPRLDSIAILDAERGTLSIPRAPKVDDAAPAGTTDSATTTAPTTAPEADARPSPPTETKAAP